MNKKYIILITVTIIYILVLFLVFGTNEIEKEQRKAIIILDDNTIWNLNKNVWSNITSAEGQEDLNTSEFTVFINYENIGKYYLTKDNNKWFLHDKNQNIKEYELGSFFAVNANYPINILKFNYKQANDKKLINKVLSDNSIKDTDELTVSTVASLDFDNDGQIEKFYALSNAFARETSPSKVFSIVFMEKNNDIYYLYKATETNDGQNGCKPYINTILDINEDNIYEIALSCGYYSIQERLDMLYTYQDNQFKLLITNE